MTATFSEIIGYILGGLGIVLTIIFGFLSIRRIRYPGEVSYVLEEVVNLVEGPFKKIEKIKLLYDAAEAGKQLTYCRILILNTGRTDLKITDNEYLKILLPKGAEVLDLNVSKFSSLLAATGKAEDNSIKITSDNFRIDEFLRLEIVFKNASDVDGLSSKIKMTTRVLNTKTKDISNKMSSASGDNFPFNLISAYTYAILLTIFFGLVLNKNLRYHCCINTVLVDSQKKEFIIDDIPKTVNEIPIKSGNLSRIVSLSEINEKYKLRLDSSPRSLINLEMILGFFTFLGSTVFLAFTIFRRRYYKKIHKLTDAS